MVLEQSLRHAATMCEGDYVPTGSGEAPVSDLLLEAAGEIERLRKVAIIAEDRLSRWLAHQYDNLEQYRVLRDARDELKHALAFAELSR